MNNRRDIAETLSGLERQVFLAVRQAGQAQVNDVLARLAGDGRDLAYTTVMTVLVRLWEKGYVIRQKQGKAYLYATRDQAEIAGELGGRVVRDALERYGAGALTGLVQTLTPEQRAIVARLLAEGAPDSGADGGSTDA
jgi:predicted transcriptional regulator